MGRKATNMEQRWPPERIRELRQAYGESQPEFAARLRVFYRTLAQWEQGRAEPGEMAQFFLDCLYEMRPEVVEPAIAGV